MTEFQIRVNAKTRLESEIVAPFATIVSFATLMLFAVSKSVPGQFPGRGFQIPIWGAVVAASALSFLIVRKWQRPTNYALDDDGIHICTAFSKKRIGYEDVKEVTCADMGGVRIDSRDGTSYQFSPTELSAFLKELERQFGRKRLDVRVNREARVQITGSCNSDPGLH